MTTLTKEGFMKMLFVLMSLLTLTSHAQESNFAELNAPVVYNRANLNEANAGAIVYDTNSGAFYGLSTTGSPTSTSSWIQLGGSTSSSNVTTSGNSQRMENVQVGNLGSSNCTSSPCTMVSNTPGVASVTRNGTGSYTVNFVSGNFSAAPVCVCSTTSAANFPTTCSPNAAPTSTSWSFASTYSGTAYDSTFTVICMGTH